MSTTCAQRQTSCNGVRERVVDTYVRMKRAYSVSGSYIIVSRRQAYYTTHKLHIERVLTVMLQDRKPERPEGAMVGGMVVTPASSAKSAAATKSQRLAEMKQPETCLRETIEAKLKTMRKRLRSGRSANAN